ncbi:MAG TPA: hypothetical protein VGR87_03550 [Candidatus Limnocylindria bacterium]|nr:hypothetical protein [Candidatus Limnocylindria bacterium]
MRPRPSGGFTEFIGRRFEAAEVLEVLAPWALIDRCVQLEEDLVATISDVQDQASPSSGMGPSEHAFRQSELRERSGTSVEPVRRKPERGCGILDRPPQLVRQVGKRD